MSTVIQNTFIQIGRTVDPALFFAPDCMPGDWRTWGRIAFQNQFPSDAVRVIVTANNFSVDPAVGNPAVVGVVAAVDRNGFDLWARNSDCAGGNAGFYFMAVEELGLPPVGEPVDLRLGIAQPRHFCPDCQPGDWNSWYPRFSSPFPVGREYAALATGCNLNVKPFGSGLCGPIQLKVGPEGGGSGGSGSVGLPAGAYYYHAPAVAIGRYLVADGFELAARNCCCTQGGCGFYHVAAVEGVPPQDRFIVDSGVVEPQSFNAACQYGSWRTWEVYFSRPFLAPPVVLLTCREADPNNRVAVVGLARDVTTHGFTLAGFNSDCGVGIASFYWVAIGCGLGCG